MAEGATLSYDSPEILVDCLFRGEAEHAWEKDKEEACFLCLCFRPYRSQSFIALHSANKLIRLKQGLSPLLPKSADSLLGPTGVSWVTESWASLSSFPVIGWLEFWVRVLLDSSRGCI